MPPPVALFLASLFIAYLFARDFKQEPNISSAVWIPTIWLFLIGSRPVTQWIGLTAPYSADQLVEGSPTDAAVMSALILAAFIVLWKRQIPLQSVIRSNPWLSVFLLFCALSIFWSDFPFVAFKRWIKGLGSPMMALIVLSDAAPGKAIEKVIKRCAYVHIPISIIFIKYYPELGRAYSLWTGDAYYTGITNNKNQLGSLLFVFGLYFVSSLLGRRARERYAGKRADLIIAILFMFMVGWLFRMADSKTALLGLIIGSVVIVASRFKFVRANLVAIILVCAALQMLFPLAEGIIASAGRDLSLTGRTDLWQSVLRFRTNDWVGSGFESYWLGDRIKGLWDEYNFKPNQAHNGYIEVFLNLGWIGLCLFVCVLWAGFRHIRRRLMSSVDKSDAAADTNHLMFTFGTGFFVAYALYNVTEATFKPLDFLFIVFLFLGIKFPRSSEPETVVVTGLAAVGKPLRSVLTETPPRQTIRIVR